MSKVNTQKYLFFLTNEIIMNEISNSDLLIKRKELLGENVPTFYEKPIHIVKGEGVWLWDNNGKKYLDCYNNVPHVGHCHPDVVNAITKQASTLNTHSRYLHEGILDYAEKLTSTFYKNLSTVIMTCTGSEANDVAIRMANSITGKNGIISTDHTYHGNTALVSQLSKTNPPKDGFLHNFKHVIAPDSYRPLGGKSSSLHSKLFADEIEKKIIDLKNSNYGFSALILCPFFANEGFPNLPPGWLSPTEKIVKKHGGLIIADEVQPGFGRMGSHMWAHQMMDLKPDIVTIGKPMANGHPVGAVISSKTNINLFRTTYNYFNTFGGNPVSCAAAMEVLNIIEKEDLMNNALNVGNYAIKSLKKLANNHEIIGDIRGKGLFFGIEFVTDKKLKTPATNITKKIVNDLRNNGILLNNSGIYGNTLKIRPNMQFSKNNTDFLIKTLEDVIRKI